MKVKIIYHPQKNLWFKKSIFKLLGLSLFSANFSMCLTLANSNIEIPDRYQTLEGEHIVIDDSTEGELHEIEIFGNTVQDENNLENIQSVGDLYVDEYGNPILDNKGKEQYKIDIISSNYNRLYTNEEIVQLYNNMGYSNVKAELTEDNKFKIVTNGAWQNPNKVFKGKPDTEYTFSFITRPGYLYTNGLHLTRNHSEYVKTYRTDSTGEFGFLVSPNMGEVFDFKICEGNIPNLNEIVVTEHTQTIILPQPLLSLNSKYQNKKLSDRLFWSNELGKYIIEKNVSMIKIDKFTHKYNKFFQYPEIINSDSINLGLLYNYEFIPFVEKMEYVGWGGVPRNSEYGIGVYSNGNIRCYQRTDIDTSLDELNEYIGDNGINMYTQLYDAQIIETNIISKLKIPTYDSKTHIYVKTKNGINPTLKVTIDKIYKVVKEALEEAEKNPTPENISLVRIYINMMPDSSYKDIFQDQIDLIDPSLNLDRKNITTNLDIYIKPKNSLYMTLSTNSVLFDDYISIDDVEIQNAVEINVTSTLPYQLNAYLVDEIYNNDRTKKIDMYRLDIKSSKDNEYKKFTGVNKKLILEDSCEAGDNTSHLIDLKLEAGDTYQSDIYKTVIKFEVEQK